MYPMVSQLGIHASRNMPVDLRLRQVHISLLQQDNEICKKPPRSSSYEYSEIILGTRGRLAHRFTGAVPELCIPRK